MPKCSHCPFIIHSCRNGEKSQRIELSSLDLQNAFPKVLCKAHLDSQYTCLTEVEFFFAPRNLCSKPFSDSISDLSMSNSSVWFSSSFIILYTVLIQPNFVLSSTILPHTSTLFIDMADCIFQIYFWSHTFFQYLATLTSTSVAHFPSSRIWVGLCDFLVNWMKWKHQLLCDLMIRL